MRASSRRGERQGIEPDRLFVGESLEGDWPSDFTGKEKPV